MVYQLSLTIENVHRQRDGGNPEAYVFVIRSGEEGRFIKGYYTTRYTKVIS